MSNGAGILIFPSDSKAVAPTNAPKGRKAKASKSKSPEEERDVQKLSEDEIKVGHDKLDTLQLAGVASACIMTILTAAGLPKHVSSVDEE